jgi:hypothetical protein
MPAKGNEFERGSRLHGLEAVSLPETAFFIASGGWVFGYLGIWVFGYLGIQDLGVWVKMVNLLW